MLLPHWKLLFYSYPSGFTSQAFRQSCDWSNSDEYGQIYQMNPQLNNTKQIDTKLCAYFMGYTVV